MSGVIVDRHRWPVVGGVMLAAMLLLPVPQAQADLAELARTGTVNGDVRLRFEQATQSGSQRARAATLRTRLGYRVGDPQKLQLFGEFEHVANAGADRYAVPGQPNPGNRAVVADPTGTELNQVYLQYGGTGHTVWRWGRQRLVWDNQRHIGNEGWRQREQTFDGLSVTTPVDDGAGTFRYAYLWNANTVTGQDVDVAAHLLHLEGPTGEGGRMMAYAYLIDQNDLPATSSQTYGTRLEQVFPLSGASMLVRVEYANQRDYQDGSFRPTDYRLAELEISEGRYVSMATLERLDGSSDHAYQTPLGSRHGFNGWADLFADGTPLTGLRDLAFTLRSKVGTGTLSVVYHRFSSADGDQDYGTEWDTLLTGPFKGGFRYGVKLARYQSDGFAGDRTRLWAWIQATL